MSNSPEIPGNDRRSAAALQHATVAADEETLKFLPG
jgi:hypothetical protein